MTAAPADTPTAPPRGPSEGALRAEHIAKRFGALTALRDVNLRLAQGEVLGLIGDNGAGKSTLIKIICGFHQPDAGRILVNGEEVMLRSRSSTPAATRHRHRLPGPRAGQRAQRLPQHVPEPGAGALAAAEQPRRCGGWPTQHLDDMGVNISEVDVEVAKLSGGQRQAIAVARSVYSDAKILLLDEPLAAMGAKEGALILDLVRDLQDRGDVSVIIIAHNYAQVLEVCDRVNLLQHGEITFDKPTGEISAAELTDLMVAEYRAARARRSS